MKRQRKIIISLLCVIGLMSCVDWQAKYKSKLEEAASPVIDNYNFIKKVCDNAKENMDCVIYDNINEIDGETQNTIKLSQFELTFKKSSGILSLSNYSSILLVHFSADDNYKLKNNVNYLVVEKEHAVCTYKDYENLKITNRKDLESVLAEFDTSFVDVIKNADYLIVVTDQILLKPQWVADGKFEQGSVLCELTIYDLKEQKELEKFLVSAINSFSVFVIDDSSISSLMNDIYYELERNIVKKLQIRAPYLR